MKYTLKRLLAFLLTLAMVCGVLPTIAFAEEPTEASAELITAEDDALVQSDILDDIDAYFTASAKRDSERTLEDYVAATDDVKALVMSSDTYMEGSIVERGDGFFWQTDTGITCGYFPKDRYEADQRVATKAVNTSALATWNYANATKKDVCLVAPMYSEDTDFTSQYTNEALAIAKATGGTAYGLIDTDATVTAIGQAIEKCGVVIFDSHGNTDWGFFDGGSDGNGEADCSSQANTSYLWLSSGTGMTTSDCAYVTGTYGTYPHAYKDSSGNYAADGTAFANHMSGDAPGSILWMAICLGMATDGMCAPLRDKGVSVVYGYSQAVSFDGDYAWEENFWDNMIAGDTVASAISKMKDKYGEWDYSQKMYNEGVFTYSSWIVSTITAARNEYCAFPIVASEEDTYPGQGNVDNYQTVKSTWTLLGSRSGECTHDWKVTQTVAATCTEGGYTLETCSLCSETRKNNITVALGHDMKTDKVVEATCTEGGYTQLKCSRCGVTEKTNTTSALGHNMVAGTVVAATCTQNGYTPYTCSRCSVTEQRNVVPAAGHSYEAVVTEPTYYAQGYTTHTCVNCGDKYVDSYTPALQPAYSITVRVSDEAFGKAFLSGNVVTAVPANGMYVSGFLLTPAYSATVVQEGNRFYITDVKEDCVLTIEFRSKDAAKVTFSVPAGCKAESLTGCVGESVELTAPTGKPVADAHDYVFAGWVETPVSEELSKPDAIFTDSYLFTKQSVTLYALYSYVYRGDTYYTTTVRMDTCLAEQFKDVDTTAWYHEALDFVLEYGYMNGVGEFKFEPNGLLTRAMMVTILYRLDGEGEYAAHPFKDVAKDTWYDEAVAWGYATGVVKGTSATTFSPDDYVTREQAATLLYRYAQYCGEDVSTMGSLMGFEDAKQISSFARDAMRWAVGEGIINGRSETVLEPLGTATRAEIAKILYGWLS